MTGILESWSGIESFVEELKADESNDIEYLEENYLKSFLSLLGWDRDDYLIENKDGAYDFTLRDDGRPLFVKIKRNNPDSEEMFHFKKALWNNYTSVGLYTDFREISVYIPDCKPQKDDDVFKGRVKHFKLDDYCEKWLEICGVLSWEIFDDESLSEELDKADINRLKSLTHELFMYFDEWRLKFGRDIYKNHPEITSKQVNQAVLLIIFRLIFFKIFEEQGILKESLKDVSTCDGFVKLCCEFDEKYGKHLFASGECENIKITDEVLGHVIFELYNPFNPFKLSDIEVNILSWAFEFYLSKQITLDDGEVKITNKKETPIYSPEDYIVFRLVFNAVGSAMDFENPRDVCELSLIDPFCSSGRFLIKSYYELLYWQKWYRKISENLPEEVIWADGFLTYEMEEKILKCCIHGLDTDADAVTTTKFLLILTFTRNKEKLSVLPDLSYNIRLGNSIINTDMRSLTDEESEKLKVCDWDMEFEEVVYEKCGFDIVVGNPPFYGVDELDERFIQYFSQRFDDFIPYGRQNYGIYCTAIMAALKFLKDGVISFILPEDFLFSKQDSFFKFYLYENRLLSEIIHFTESVFIDTDKSSCILLLEDKPLENFYYVEACNLDIYKENSHYVYFYKFQYPEKLF